jgi:hypothetical protein
MAILKNKKIYLSLFFAIILNNYIFPSFLGYTNDKKINLDDSIKLAILNNRKLQIADEELSLIKYKTSEALSYRLPKLDFLLNYGNFNIENENSIINNGENVFLLDKDNKEVMTTRFNLTQVLYRGNFAKNIKKTSEANIKKAKSEQEIIKNDIIISTKNLFYEYIFLEKKYFFYEKYKTYLDIIKNFINVNNNLFSDNEKLEIENFIENFEYEFDNLELEKNIKKFTLFKNIGIEQTSLLEIEGNFNPIDYKNKELNECIAKALFIRPELIVSEASEELGFLEVNIAMNERNPIIALNATYDYSANINEGNLSESEYWGNDWFVGINLTLPIIDGGAFLARNNQKKSNLKKLKLKRAETEENIKLEVTKIFFQYELNKKRFFNNEKIYINFINNKKYTHIIDFFESQDNKILQIKNKNELIENLNYFKNYKNVKNNYLSSILEYNKSIFDLQMVTGEID